MSTRYFLGVDVSELNGEIDWWALKRAGVEFAIIRAGYGNQHLDSEFYNNVNGAEAIGIPYGIYWYSCALSDEQAGNEADYVLGLIDDCNANPTLGVYIDMENDKWKINNGFTDPQEITNACSVFINRVWAAGKTAGLYANYDWLVNKIYVDQLGGPLIWCAQYSKTCDLPCDVWQFTDSLDVGVTLDGDEIREGSQLFHVMEG